MPTAETKTAETKKNAIAANTKNQSEANYHENHKAARPAYSSHS